MIYLSGVLHPALDHPRAGWLLTPRMRAPREAVETSRWAADTGCYAQPDSFVLHDYLAWLHRMTDTPAALANCLFATAPDRLGDADATWRASQLVLPLIRGAGIPAALVAQEGIGLAPPWDAFDVLFIGGGTAFKLASGRLVQEAKRRGKWVHVGRVNSLRRLVNVVAMGADSCDGTFLRRAPDVNLPRLTAWLDHLDRQPLLLSEHKEDQ